MLPFIFHKRLFLYLFVSFILAVVVGIMSHECGHWLVTRCFGFHGQHIRYNATVYGRPDDKWLRRDSTLQAEYAEFSSGVDFPSKGEYQKLQNTRDRDYFLITAGGPLETMLAGTIGLLLLFLYRKKIAQTDWLFFAQWLWSSYLYSGCGRYLML